MRRLVYGVAASLDGFIAGPNGAADWILPDSGIDFTVIDQGEAIEVTLALGSEGLAATWYIKDEGRKQRFASICNSLDQDSEDFERFRRSPSPLQAFFRE